MGFSQNLNIGKAGESGIATWLKAQGAHILPVYEKIIDEGKGPQLFLSNNTSLVAPDLLCFGNTIFWAEVKAKSAFTWHHNTGAWTTGIDLRHYEDYMEVQKSTKLDIWLFFLHTGGEAKNTPLGKVSPSGLYSNSLRWLAENEHHRHKNWGRSGMVYWEITAFKKLDEWPFLKTGAKNQSEPCAA